MIAVQGAGKTSMAYHLFDMGDKSDKKSKKAEQPPPSPTYGVFLPISPLCVNFQAYRVSPIIRWFGIGLK